MRALNLAVSGKVMEHIIPSFKTINSFLKEWNLDVKDQRDLFLGISNVLRENKRYNRKIQSESEFNFHLFNVHCLVLFLTFSEPFLWYLQLRKGFFQIPNQVFSNLLG